jgi:hypothetical protein
MNLGRNFQRRAAEFSGFSGTGQSEPFAGSYSESRAGFLGDNFDVVDFVAVKAQKIHTNQQARRSIR